MKVPGRVLGLLCATFVFSESPWWAKLTEKTTTTKSQRTQRLHGEGLNRATHRSFAPKDLHDLTGTIAPLVIRAVREIEFEPAVKNGKKVAQYLQLEYSFGTPDKFGGPIQSPVSIASNKRLKRTLLSVG